MARKRTHLTTDILADVLHRLGIGAAAIDREALRLRMDLPEYDGFVEDDAVAAALRHGEARRAFAETGVALLRSALPALRAEPGRDGDLVWTLRVNLPLLDDGRLDLRIDVPPGEAAAEILEEMALGDDPARHLDGLRGALAGTAAVITASLGSTIARLRVQISEDLHETGADAPTYIAHLDRSLRSRIFMPAPNLPAPSATRSRPSAPGRRWWRGRNPAGGACATGSDSAATSTSSCPPAG